MSTRGAVSLVLAAAAVLVVLAAGGSGPRTKLTVNASSFWGGHTYRLECDPAGGDVPQPAALCEVLNANAGPMLLEPTRALCFGGLPSFRLEVNGEYRGRTVAASFWDCAGDPVGARLWLSQLRPLPERWPQTWPRLSGAGSVR